MIHFSGKTNKQKQNYACDWSGVKVFQGSMTTQLVAVQQADTATPYFAVSKM